MQFHVTIDVPDLEQGLRFYRDAMQLEEVSRPVATYVILRCGNGRIGLMEKGAGTRAAQGTKERRGYRRHWTPVHIDFEVEDYEGTLERAVAAGAIVEQTFDVPGRPATAFCSDPFGNGFDVIRTPKPDESSISRKADWAS